MAWKRGRGKRRGNPSDIFREGRRKRTERGKRDPRQKRHLAKKNWSKCTCTQTRKRESAIVLGEVRRQSGPRDFSTSSFHFSIYLFLPPCRRRHSVSQKRGREGGKGKLTWSSKGGGERKHLFPPSSSSPMINVHFLCLHCLSFSFAFLPFPSSSSFHLCEIGILNNEASFVRHPLSLPHPRLPPPCPTLQRTTLSLDPTFV